MVFGAGVSEDGANWKVVNRKSSSNLFYDGEKFVQVLDNVFSYSFDGIEWTSKTITTNMENIRFYEIIKGKDTYYAVGSREIPSTTGVSQLVGLVASSKDGINWFIKEFKEKQWFTSYLTDICWNGSTFVMTGEDILMSSDGVNWNVVYKSGDYESVNDVIWDGRQFMAFGGDYNKGMFIYTSADGKSWTKKQCYYKDGKALGRPYPRNAIWDGSNYFLVTAYDLKTSKDGVIWEQVNLPLFRQTALNHIFIFKNDYYLFGAPYEYIVLKSKDGFDWKAIYQPPMRSIDSIAKFKEMYIGKDFEGSLYYSADRAKWTRVTMDSRYKFYRIAYVNDRVFAYGEVMDRTSAVKDVVFSTTDGVNWKENNCNIESSMLKKIIWDGKRYISLTSNGIATSEDGALWTSLNVEGLQEAIFDINYNGSKYVLLCNKNIIMESDDLKKFIKHELKMDNYCSNIVWDGNRYYLTGYGDFPLINDDYAKGILNNQFYDTLSYLKIYSSGDLDNWSEKSLNLYSKPSQLLFVGGTLYITVGGVILKSEDGNNWQREYYDDSFYNIMHHLGVM